MQPFRTVLQCGSSCGTACRVQLKLLNPGFPYNLSLVGRAIGGYKKLPCRLFWRCSWSCGKGTRICTNIGRGPGGKDESRRSILTYDLEASNYKQPQHQSTSST